MINVKGRMYRVITNPVEHSMSSLMQNFYGQETSVGFTHVPSKMLKGDVETAMAGAYALNIWGLDVTVPHKQRVMPYLKEIDEDTKAIGAVSTLVRVDGGYRGYNTDAAGLPRAIQGEDIEIAGQDYILIGVDGAAKAAAYMLTREGARIVYTLSRNVGRTEELARKMNERFGGAAMHAMALEEYDKLPYVKDGYLAMQTTSVGMYGTSVSGSQEGQASVKDTYSYPMIHTGVNIIYTPVKTAFMSCMGAADGRIMNGLTMLLHQGVKAFETWNLEVKVSKETVEKAKELVMARLGG